MILSIVVVSSVFYVVPCLNPLKPFCVGQCPRLWGEREGNKKRAGSRRTRPDSGLLLGGYNSESCYGAGAGVGVGAGAAGSIALIAAVFVAIPLSIAV